MRQFIVRLITLSLLSIVSIAILAAEPVKHTVKRGETLESIATLYKLTAEQLIEANHLAGKKIYVGMNLIIPIPTESSDTETTTIITHGSTKSGDTTDISRSDIPSQNQTDKITETECGIFATVGLPFDNFLKGGLLELEGNISGPGWNNIGAYFATGFNLQWDPEFNVSSALVSLGPSYTIHLNQNIHLLIPIAAMAGFSHLKEMDTGSGKIKEKTKISWGCKVAPKFIYKRFGFSVFGIFTDRDPGFGMSFSVEWI